MSATVVDVFGVAPPMLALFCGVAFVGFLVSSMFGVGGAMLLIPALLLALPAGEAVALAAPVMLANNAFKLLVFRRHLDAPGALLVAATALPAAVVGALFTGILDERWLKAGIAALIFASLAVQYGLGRDLVVTRRQLPLWGVVIGGISGLCGAAGGPTALAYKGIGHHGERFVATIALLAIGMQLVKVPTYVVTGVLPLSRWPLAVLLGSAALVAVLLGRVLLTRIGSARRYRGLLDAVLFCLGAALLATAFL